MLLWLSLGSLFFLLDAVHDLHDVLQGIFGFPSIASHAISGDLVCYLTYRLGFTLLFYEVISLELGRHRPEGVLKLHRLGSGGEEEDQG